MSFHYRNHASVMKAIWCQLQKNTSHVFFEYLVLHTQDRKYFCYQIKKKQKTKEKQKIAIPLQFSSKITVSREIT